MLEPLRCPGCSTRFLLDAARLRPGLKRALCFRCSAIFSIEPQVERLLAAPALAVEPVVPVVEPVIPVVEPATLEPLVLEPLALDAFPPQATEPSAPVAPQGVEVPGEPEAQVPQITPDDLRGIEVEAANAITQPEVPNPDAGSGYTSAKDAIARLMGATPAAQAPVRLGSRSTMDVEATLDALSSTLGGAVPEPERPAPPRGDLSSTVKLTSEEIKVAMAAMGAQAKPAEPAPAAPRLVPPVEFTPVPLGDPGPTPGGELLKVQLEQETCNNVAVEQMAAWVEQGRVLEYHMVARQYSDHWIEASKVPALRPVFERVRKLRETQIEEATAKPQVEAPPVKRGLFSGLFGRG